MIAGAHSREVGDVRGAVHYGTFSHEEPPSETPSSSEVLRIPLLEAVMNSIRNGLGMRETKIVK
jgi:hypothetical protein